MDNALRKALLDCYPELARIHLTDYKVRVLDEDAATGAKVRVLIQTAGGGRSWGTVGVSTNIIEASWLALVDSVEYGLMALGVAADGRPADGGGRRLLTLASTADPRAGSMRTVALPNTGGDVRASVPGIHARCFHWRLNVASGRLTPASAVQRAGPPSPGVFDDRMACTQSSQSPTRVFFSSKSL